MTKTFHPPFLFIPLLLLWICFSLSSCTEPSTSPQSPSAAPLSNQPFVMVLGVAQDAGAPQAACQKSCCRSIWNTPALHQKVACLGIADPESKQFWLIDATPDFKVQHQQMSQLNGTTWQLTGIFLTHAHMGHYTGLMHLGREAMGADQVPVYAMPKMRSFLHNNGPWSQLVGLKNIQLKGLKKDSTIVLNERLKITPLQVPHRDEFSETVGFRVEGPQKQLLYIPDIDKWHLWEQSINELIPALDWALLDGTFYKNGEIAGRDMSQIPHPFVEESMATFESLSDADKSKIHFIHFNHTNPLIQAGSSESTKVQAAGYQLAREKEILDL